MSKTKLAILVFCIAFGVNLGAFFFSKKAFQVEELKNVWIFELPPTASPLDASSSIDLGPQQGIVGTLFRPNFKTDAPLETLLADTWTWNDKTKQLSIRLKSGLTFSDGLPITAEYWVASAKYLATFLEGFKNFAEWGALKNASWVANDALNLTITLSQLSPKFDFEKFAGEVLSHPMSGVIHPTNLDSLAKGEKVTSKWISSGPYKVRKWNPKEITLVSRDDFPVMLPKEFFRTLRFQSAPVRNPSCHFIQAAMGEERGLEEHFVSPTQEALHVFWICRSWSEKGSFCANPENRASFAKLIAGTEIRSSQTLVSQKVRYRIPTGSDVFRDKIRNQIVNEVKKMGGTTEEISYFFKPSTDADIELLFVVAPRVQDEAQVAQAIAGLSSRLGPNAQKEPNLVGEIASYPIQILMKNMKGDVFDTVFLKPDLEQKLPL